MANKLSPYIFNQYFDDNGDPLNAGKIYAYSTGTTDDKDTYTTQDGTTPNANPIILDAAGRAIVYLGTGFYDFVIKDSLNNVIDTVDRVFVALTDSGVPNTFVENIAALKALADSGLSDGDYVTVGGYYARVMMV